jgi:hypothetical protein
MGSSACFLRCFNGAVVAFAAESVATVRVASVWASSLAFLLAGIFSFLLFGEQKQMLIGLIRLVDCEYGLKVGLSRFLV